MKKSLLVVIFICPIFYLSAQEKIRVKSGDDFSEALSSFGIYRFPSFMMSDIYFRNGTVSSARLNYNLVLGEVQFIDDKGDTLSIANPEELKILKIDTLLFYYNKKYIEILSGKEDEIKLGSWQQIKIEFEQLGAYDRPAGGVDAKSYKTYSSPSGGNVYELKANQNRIITREIHLFLVDKFGAIFPATKNNFLHFFSHKKDAILTYLDGNKTDFKKTDDLKKLFQFCRQSS